MISVLSKLLGLQYLDKAQDIVQDTLVMAMNTWSFNGLPDNPYNPGTIRGSNPGNPVNPYNPWLHIYLHYLSDLDSSA